MIKDGTIRYFAYEVDRYVNVDVEEFLDMIDYDENDVFQNVPTIEQISDLIFHEDLSLVKLIKQIGVDRVKKALEEI
jgi:hypothetical protein